MIRATPGASREKRKNTGPQNTPQSARRRRHTVSLNETSMMPNFDNSPVPDAPPAKDRRVVHMRRTSTTNTSPRRRYKRRESVIIDNKQRTIVDMLSLKEKENTCKKGEKMVKGIKQLVVSDAEDDKVSGSGSDILDDAFQKARK